MLRRKESKKNMVRETNSDLRLYDLKRLPVLNFSRRNLNQLLKGKQEEPPEKMAEIVLLV